MKSKLLNIVILFLLAVGGNVFADDFNYSIRVVNNTDTVITTQPFDNMGVPVCEPENVILSTHNSSKTCDADPTFQVVPIGSFWAVGDQNPQRSCPGIRLPNDLNGQTYTFTFEGTKATGYSCQVLSQTK